MNTWKVILATMVIFGTGVVTGGLLVHHSERFWTPQRPREGGQGRTASASSAGGMRLEFLRRAQRDLDLTKDQRDRVDEILKKSQERNRKLMEPISPELRAELERTRTEFMEVLTREQRTRFDELVKQQQQQQRGRKQPPQPREHPPGNPTPTTTPALVPPTNATPQ